MPNAMVRCGSNITLGDYLFNYHADCEITTAWKTLTDTATLSMPKKVIYTSRGNFIKADELIKRGDKASIAVGYDDRITQRFTGYVTALQPNMPMKINMEDEMFIYKTQAVKPRTFINGHVADILQHLGITNYKLIGDIGIVGDFVLDSRVTNVSKALLKLKECIGFPIFMRNSVLHIGDPYDVTAPNHVILSFGINIISHSLVYKDAAEVKIKVIAISHNRNGKKIRHELGDHDGETHTLNFYNESEKTLVTRAEALIGKLKYSGFRGDMQLFGEPIVNHGDIVQLYDPMGEITGSYWVDAVKIKGGTGGIRQSVTLGMIANGK